MGDVVVGVVVDARIVTTKPGERTIRRLRPVVATPTRQFRVRFVAGQLESSMAMAWPLIMMRYDADAAAVSDYSHRPTPTTRYAQR